MNRSERYASIALGMIIEPGMSPQASYEALVNLGIKPKVAQSVVAKTLARTAPDAPGKRSCDVTKDGTEESGNAR